MTTKITAKALKAVVRKAIAKQPAKDLKEAKEVLDEIKEECMHKASSGHTAYTTSRPWETKIMMLVKELLEQDGFKVAVVDDPNSSMPDLNISWK